MLKAKLALGLVLVLIPAVVCAASLGTVTKILRPEVHTFDASGQPTGTLSAGDIKTPTPILALGTGGSVGIGHGGKTVFLRGLDVQTQGLNATCKPVQGSARASGSSYAATNMGLGGAADCQPAH